MCKDKMNCGCKSKEKKCGCKKQSGYEKNDFRAKSSAMIPAQQTMLRTSGYSKKNDETPIVTKIKISEESAPPKYNVEPKTIQVQATAKEDNDGFYMAAGGFALLLLLLGRGRKD